MDINIAKQTAVCTSYTIHTDEIHDYSNYTPIYQWNPLQEKYIINVVNILLHCYYMPECIKLPKKHYKKNYSLSQKSIQCTRCLIGYYIIQVSISKINEHTRIRSYSAYT